MPWTTSSPSWGTPPEAAVLLEPDVVRGRRPAAERAALAEPLRLDKWHDQDLFAQALAHRSWCAEHPGKEPNERLEFLGDAVLGQIVTDYLYRSYPDLPEGELAKGACCRRQLGFARQHGRELQLGNALLLGKGEDSSGGRLKPSILADAMEAVIGAIYLDAGYSVSEEIVLRLLEERLTGGGQRTGRGGLQDHGSRSSAPRPSTSCPCTGSRTAGRTTPRSSRPRCSSAVAPGGRGRAARRSKPSRWRHGTPGSAIKADREGHSSVKAGASLGLQAGSRGRAWAPGRKRAGYTAGASHAGAARSRDREKRFGPCLSGPRPGAGRCYRPANGPPAPARAARRPRGRTSRPPGAMGSTYCWNGTTARSWSSISG